MISFGVNLVMFVAVSIFVYGQASRRTDKPTHWLRYGPTYLTVLATVLIMADNTRHVLLDQKLWQAGPFPGASQYQENCKYKTVSVPYSNCTENADCGTFDCGNGHFAVMDGATCRSCDTHSLQCVESEESFACLSIIGWIFTVGFTYSGFMIFFFASFWNANLIGKLRKISDRWKALRQAEHGKGSV